MKKTGLFLLLFYPVLLFGQDSLQVMFYNLYRFPDAPPANREYLLKAIVDSACPDLLMACEIVNKEGSDRILHTAFGELPDSFARARFVNSPDTEDPLQQMVFYNTRKLRLIRQATLPTLVRDINHYTFVLNTADIAADSVFLDAFVTHLKSSTGAGNVAFRLGMVDTFVKALKDISPDHHVLFAGDFNFYNAEEPGYQRILDSTNPILMVDPLNRPGDWHDNKDFRDIHTQATRITAAGFGIGGASGGMDDRFDFIMMSQNSNSDPHFTYLKGSYKAFGNNGDCFNKRIDDLSSNGPYSLALRQLLYNMSDHTPIIMTFKTNKDFAITGITHTQKEPVIKLLNGNIAKDHLLIKITGNTNRKSHILIYNTMGKKLITLSPGKSRNTRIDISAFPCGLYFLKMAGTSSEAVKFIKW